MFNYESPLYGTWSSMKSRCQNPNNQAYSNYGARGITVCEEWQEFKSFEEWAMNNGYTEGLTLGRKNNDGPYAPWNCSFETYKDQNRNSRNNRLITIGDETKCISEWVEDPRCSVKFTAICRRLDRGWSDEEAVLSPKYHQRNSVE